MLNLISASSCSTVVRSSPTTSPPSPLITSCQHSSSQNVSTPPYRNAAESRDSACVSGEESDRDLHSPTSLENSSCTSEENPLQLRTLQNPLKLRDNAKLAGAGECESTVRAAAHRRGDWSGQRPTVIENSANVDLTNGDYVNLQDARDRKCVHMSSAPRRRTRRNGGVSLRARARAGETGKNSWEKRCATRAIQPIARCTRNLTPRKNRRTNLTIVSKSLHASHFEALDAPH